MKKLIFILVSIITITSFVTSQTRTEVPICEDCNSIDVYCRKYGMYDCYLVFDYIDSMYYGHNTSDRSSCQMGFFTVHNDTITLVETAYMVRTKNYIRVCENDTSELDYYTYHYRIEGGGDSIYIMQLLPEWSIDEFFFPPTLLIEKYYKCRGSLDYLPMGENLWDKTEKMRDSLQKEYEKKGDSLQIDINYTIF